MPINITGAGAVGTHTLSRTNVNTEEDFIYFVDDSPENSIPSAFLSGTTFIYSPSVGALGGIASGDLLYVTTVEPKKLTFSQTTDGGPVNYTGSSRISVSSTAQDNNTITVVSSTVHNLTSGQIVKVSGSTRIPNGSFSVTVVDTTTFTYQDSSFASLVAGTDNVTQIIRDPISPGNIFFNSPVVFDNKLNIDGSTPDNQAVKYFTTGDPLNGLQNGDTYFLKNTDISAFSGQQALYDFVGNSHTFTTCGQTGRVGPTFQDMVTTYSSKPWRQNFLSQGDFRGYQDWTVPVSGIYEFNVRGAAGGTGNGSGAAGRGAIVQGRVSLTKGEVITVVVGQRGDTGVSTRSSGSGGGSFVVRKSSNQPLFIAGGGTANSNTLAGQDAVLTTVGGPSTDGIAANFSEGVGGLVNRGWSAAGGGFLTRGQSTQIDQGGGSFVDGLTMDANDSTRVGYGGFGGGAQGDVNALHSGGAGGFSGGAGSSTRNSSPRNGGGGGSFITNTASNVATSTGQFNGENTISSQAITNLNSFNANAQGQISVSLVSSFTTGNSLYPTATDAANGTNEIEIQSAGNSYHSLLPINLDLALNTVYTPSPHTLSEGEAVVLNFNGTPPANIQNGIIYYVDFVSTYSYRLSTTPSPDFSIINFTIPSSNEVSTNSTLSRVVVNTASDILTVPNHGFLVDQPLTYNTGEGNPIVPLINNNTYYVAEVVNANQIRLKVGLLAPNPLDLTSPGTGTSHSFIFLTVNVAENTIYIPNHGLITGQSIRYENGGGTSIGGLTSGTTYFISRVDSSLIRLSTSQANLEGSVANLTTSGTGVHLLILTSINFTTNIITLPSHGFLDGELVEYDSKGQQVIAGLTTATPYYVIEEDGDNIRLALTPQDVIDKQAVDLEESPTAVGTHSFRSLSKTPDGIYEIATVPDKKEFTVVSNGTVPRITKEFNPRATLDLNLETFKIESHGFITGTEVRYLKGDSATNIGGITDDTSYFTVTVNRDYIKLASSSENAAAGITLDITDFGTGVAHQFVTSQINGNVTGGGNVTIQSGSVLVNGSGTSFSKILKVGDRFRLFPADSILEITFASADVNTTTNIISGDHTFSTGDAVIFSANGGQPPAPLVDQFYYFVRDVSETTIKLYGSPSDAENDLNAFDFTTQGTGSGFKLTRTSPASPIIRTITALGSDTQITVDRPYANNYVEASYSFPTFLYVRPQGYSLHRPFDGGVEMSVGAGTSLGQIIRQTRKYFRYQSGKGIQVSFGINFKPSIDLEYMKRFSETQIECKTRRPHGLVTGLFIVVSQSTDSSGELSEIYNGTFQVIVDTLTEFRLNALGEVPEGANSRAYGFPQFFVREWSNGAIRSGMFDFQNGMFFEFDGDKLYACRRSSTQQMAGTISALQGSELIFGEGTAFTAQLVEGDFVVLRGQTYRIADIESDTRMTVRPEYKGSSGVIVEFDPGNGSDGVVKLSSNVINIVGHGLASNTPVIYDSIDGEPLGGIVNGRTYYVELVNNNSFKLKATPDSQSPINLTSVGTTNLHAFTPAQSGVIVTKTVDTRVPQEDWSIDPCDGTGPSGYDIDISRIQMAYIDYSWYGAGKIRFGFKTTNGQVEYVHEFIHNNSFFESYFRSGNLPCRYEVITATNPTYIPFLFHWGTSVIMDGMFDEDRSYLFTQASQALNVPGTTTKSFASDGIDLTTDLFTVQTHGFKTGNVLEFQSIAANGLPGNNVQNPATQIVGSNTTANLINTARYGVFVNSPNLIHLTPPDTTVSIGGSISRAGTTVTVVTNNPHDLTTGDYVGIYGITNTILADANGPYYVTVTSTTSFTYTKSGTAQASVEEAGLAVAEVINFTSQGNTQYTYFLYPEGSFNNTSGPNYQPLISIRLSPSVSEGLTGALGDRDIINRMQLRLQEIGISSTQLVDVKVMLNGRLNNLNFQGVDTPSLVQIVEHTARDTISGGVQIYNFKAAGGQSGAEESTIVDVSELFELSNSILGGDSIFPDGPDILTIAVSRLTPNNTITGAKMTWTEAQA